MRDYFNMVYGFNSLVYFLCSTICWSNCYWSLCGFHKSSCVLAVVLQIIGLARIVLSVGQDAYISWTACMFSFTVNVSAG